jgi:MerR family transcriptional regulator, light-induced transcriptional regulator
MTIQQISQELGIGVDTLRIWERRFGFPQPGRDARGHRCYPEDQVEELRTIKKLQNLGYRPRQIFAMGSGQRQQLLSRQHPPEQDALLNRLQQLSPRRLDEELQQKLGQLGLQRFVSEFAIPLIQALDRGWIDGSISIAREHLLSDRLTELLKQIIQAPEPRGQVRILFLTLSGERHKLGLLLSAALMRAEGCECLLIQEELPLAEVAPLVAELGSHAVALSFSVHYRTRQAKQDLADLRKSLPSPVKIIAGGHALRNGLQLPGVLVCTDLGQISTLCKREFPAT